MSEKTTFEKIEFKDGGVVLIVDKETVLDEWDLPNPYKGQNEHVKVLQDEIVDQRRWSTDHELTIERGGLYYQTCYSVGSTEYQEEGPWEYDKEVEFWQVQPVEKVVTVYEPVKAPA